MPLTPSEINAHTYKEAQPVATNGNSCRPWHAKTLPQGTKATPAKISINNCSDNNVSIRNHNKPLSDMKTRKVECGILSS